jgi:hypothetical protein
MCCSRGGGVGGGAAGTCGKRRNHPCPYCLIFPFKTVSRKPGETRTEASAAPHDGGEDKEEDPLSATTTHKGEEERKVAEEEADKALTEKEADKALTEKEAVKALTEKDPLTAPASTTDNVMDPLSALATQNEKEGDKGLEEEETEDEEEADEDKGTKDPLTAPATATINVVDPLNANEEEGDKGSDDEEETEKEPLTDPASTTRNLNDLAAGALTIPVTHNENESSTAAKKRKTVFDNQALPSTETIVFLMNRSLLKVRINSKFWF